MNEDTLLQNKKRQRINAYTAMCGVGILLIVMRVLLYFFSRVIYLFEGLVLNDTIKALSVMFAKLFKISQFDAFTAVKTVFTSPAFDSIVSMLISLFTIVLPAYIFLGLQKDKQQTFFETRGKISKNIFSLFCFSQLFATGMSVFSNAIYTFFFGSDTKAVSQIPAYTDGFSAFVTFLQICVFVPIVEEYVFRGVIFGSLKKHGAVFAAVASASCFAIMHSDAVQANYAFTFGIFSAVLYYVTGNLKTSIIIHALNNSVSVFFDYASKWFGKTFSNTLFCIYSILIAVFGIYALFLFFRKDGYLEKFKGRKKQGFKQEYHAGLFEILCVPVVFYVVVYALEVVFTELFA